MCLIAGMFGASAAAAASAQAVTGLVISAVGTVAGIAQAQQSAAMQAQQAQQQMNLQYRQAQQQAFHERNVQVQQHIGAVKAQQAQGVAYQDQLFNNSQAANRVYTTEQQKVVEARTKAAFESQAILAKTIGAKGRVLASGLTGQSVGLLAMDAERQGGFGMAQQNAVYRSALTNSALTMEAAKLENQSANNMALSRLSAPVQAPILAPDPEGIGDNLNLGIPAYKW